MTNNCADKMDGESALRRRLKEKNDFFKRMVNLIPAKYYLDKDTKRTGEKFYKNMKEAAPRQQLKEKSTKLSRKKQRLDPDAKQDLRVTEVQEALAKREEERERRRREKQKEEEEEAEEEEEEEEAESSADEMGGLDEGLQGLGENADGKDWSQAKVPEPISVEHIQSSASIDDLRRKVQEKIERLRQQRNAKSLAGNTAQPQQPAPLPKKAAKAAREAEAKKRRRQETYEAVKASREQKQQEKARQKSRDDGRRTEEGDDPAAGADGSAAPQDQSKVAFSKFDFDEAGPAGSKKKTKKKKKRKGEAEEKLSGRDYEGLLKKVQAKKQKIAAVKRTDPEAAEGMVQQDQWRAALERAQGKTVRDDPELLKKSIRKKKERKRHSEKKWTERDQRTDELKAERQKKRRTNLKGRKDARRAKKVKRLQKKGKLLMKDSDYN